MTPRETFIAELRKLVGTPWIHGQSVPGVGMDCVTSIAFAARRSGLHAPVPVAYSPQSNRGELERHVRSLASPVAIEDMQPGDLLLFSRTPGAHAGHLGALVETEPLPLLFHAHQNRRRGGMALVEPLHGPLRRMLHSVYRPEGF